MSNITIPISKPDLPSDQNLIEFTIDTDVSCPAETKYITSYSKTNWQKYRSDLNNNIKITPELPTTQSIDDAVDKLSKAILRVKGMNSYKIKTNRNLEQLPNFILNKIKTKSRLYS